MTFKKNDDKEVVLQGAMVHYLENYTIEEAEYYAKIYLTENGTIKYYNVVGKENPIQNPPDTCSICVKRANIHGKYKTTKAIPITPAKSVLFKAFSPNDASTVLEDISSNLVGIAPELINSTNLVADSLVKLPWIITSDAKASFTYGADKQCDPSVPHNFSSFLKLSSPSS